MDLATPGQGECIVCGHKDNDGDGSAWMASRTPKHPGGHLDSEKTSSGDCSESQQPLSARLQITNKAQFASFESNWAQPFSARVVSHKTMRVRTFVWHSHWAESCFLKGMVRCTSNPPVGPGATSIGALRRKAQEAARVLDNRSPLGIACTRASPPQSHTSRRQRAVLTVSAPFDAAGLETRFVPWADSIFHQRLQNQIGHMPVQRVWRNVHFDGGSVPNRSFDFKVRFKFNSCRKPSS